MGGVERLNSAMLREDATKTSAGDETWVKVILKAGTNADGIIVALA
jgi:hypothetical protein